MYNYSFIINGTEYRRVNKSTAKKEYDNGNNVLLCACNLRPNSCWSTAVPVSNCNSIEFDKQIREFEYYNCTSKETGYYASFYIV